MVDWHSTTYTWESLVNGVGKLLQLYFSYRMQLSVGVQTVLVVPCFCIFASNPSSTGLAACSYNCPRNEGSWQNLWRWSERMPAGLMNWKRQCGLYTPTGMVRCSCSCKRTTALQGSTSDDLAAFFTDALPAQFEKGLRKDGLKLLVHKLLAGKLRPKGI